MVKGWHIRKKHTDINLQFPYESYLCVSNALLSPEGYYLFVIAIFMPLFLNLMLIGISASGLIAWSACQSFGCLASFHLPNELKKPKYPASAIRLALIQ